VTWNYRIIHHDDHEHPYFGLHEIYYDDEGITNWTVEATVVGDDVNEVIHSLRMMLKDAENSSMLIHSQINSPGPTASPARR